MRIGMRERRGEPHFELAAYQSCFRLLGKDGATTSSVAPRDGEGQIERAVGSRHMRAAESDNGAAGGIQEVGGGATVVESAGEEGHNAGFDKDRTPDGGRVVGGGSGGGDGR